MAESLRQRFSKRIANANSKGPPPDTGAGNPLDDVQQELTQDLKDEQSRIQNDRSTISQNFSHRLRSSKESSMTTSPSQSLLNKFQKGEPTASAKTAKTQVTYKVGKNTAFSEHFEDDSPRMSTEWVDVPGTLETGSEADVQVQSVTSEVMGWKSHAAEAPHPENDEEPFVYERRATRSQSRRQQRSDATDAADDATVKEDGLIPPALTVKKVIEKASRTPSPNATVGNVTRIAGHMAPTPANSPNVSAATMLTPTTLVVDRTKGKAEHRLSASPNSFVSDNTIIYGQGRELPQPPNNDDFVVAIPTSVIPPRYIANIRPEHIWTSPLACSSRPEYPYGWMKKWSCCRCAHLDPHGRNQPAETIVEQKVCSRMKCKHVRCGLGCKMLRASQFDNSSSFMSP